MPKYKYEALRDASSQIRLLQLEASDDPTCWKATLTRHDLTTAPSFVALSYEWGEPDLVLDIRLNGSIFQIRHNLWTFLETLDAKIKRRTMRPDTLFWVDAVCTYSHRSRIKYLRKLRFTIL